MEDLSKHQLILLVILITFVTSIATGIITFTLLSEAPVEVTQQINRVVEKTIERVVTEPGKPDKVVTTVVVNEEDRVLEAIAKNEKSIVRIRTIGADGTEVFSGFGILISSDGTMVSDARSYNANSSYTLLFYDGKSYPAGKIYLNSESGLVFIKTNIPKEEISKYTFYPAVFGNSDLLKIGQSLVALSGRDSNAVSIGRVRQLNFAVDKATVLGINSDISVGRITPGGPALSLSGEIVGIEAPVLEGEVRYSYIPANVVKSTFTKALEELAKK